MFIGYIRYVAADVPGAVSVFSSAVVVAAVAVATAAAVAVATAAAVAADIRTESDNPQAFELLTTWLTFYSGTPSSIV